MADRTVRVRLEVDGSQYVGVMAKARLATQGLNSELQATDRRRAAMGQLAGSAALAGTALVGAAGAMVGVAANFDRAMSGVRATGEDARENFDALRQAALQAGKDTAFSATEAADGITQLAKAGVSAKDILGGGLRGALDLAAAGQIGVGQAAELAASAMTQFGLKGKDVPHIADLMAAAAGKAQGEVADMGLALSYVGPVAGQMGISIEETSGAIALLASNGILGEKAGTNLRGVLMSLTAPSVVAKKTMDAYGISVYDATGKFVGFDGVAEQLHTRLGGLSEAQRNEALGRMFGNEQMVGALTLYKAGAKGVGEWTKQVNDSGYASRTAATLMDNLAGDFERLKGSVETAFIQAGSGAQQGLRTIVQAVDGLVQRFSDLPAPIQQATVLLSGGAGLGLLGAAAVLKVTSGVRDLNDTLGGLRSGLSLGRLAFSPWTLAIGAGAAALYGLTRLQEPAVVRAEEFTESLDKQTGAVTDLTRSMVAQRLEQQGVLSAAQRTGLSLDMVTRAALGEAGAQERVAARLRELGVARGDDLRLGRITAQQRDQSIEDQHLLTDAIGMTSEEYRSAQAAIERQNEAMGKGHSAAADYYNAISRGGVAAGTAAAGAKDLGDKAGDAATGQKGLGAETKKTADQLAYLATATWEALDAAKEQRKETGEAALSFDTTTRAGVENQAMLDGLAQKHMDVIKATRDDGGSQADYQRQLGLSRAALTVLGRSLGLTGSDLSTFARAATQGYDEAGAGAAQMGRLSRKELETLARQYGLRGGDVGRFADRVALMSRDAGASAAALQRRSGESLAAMARRLGLTGDAAAAMEKEARRRFSDVGSQSEGMRKRNVDALARMGQRLGLGQREAGAFARNAREQYSATAKHSEAMRQRNINALVAMGRQMGVGGGQARSLAQEAQRRFGAVGGASGEMGRRNVAALTAIGRRLGLSGNEARDFARNAQRQYSSAAGQAESFAARHNRAMRGLRGAVVDVNTRIADVAGKLGKALGVTGRQAAAAIGKFGLASGGPIRRDGRITGPGTGTSDSITVLGPEGLPNHRVSDGEWVVRQRVASREGPDRMRALNEGRATIVALATGGEVRARYPTHREDVSPESAAAIRAAVSRSVRAAASRTAKRVADRAVDGYVQDLARAMQAAASAVTGGSGSTVTGGKGRVTAAWHQSGSWAAGHHTGVDFGVPIGTPLFAARSGRIVPTNWGGAYGTQVVLRAGSRDIGYAHLSRRTASGTVGAGQQIGLSGATGRVTGPHLHFEVRPAGGGYGSDVNPMPYVNVAGAGPFGGFGAGLFKPVSGKGWRIEGSPPSTARMRAAAASVAASVGYRGDWITYPSSVNAPGSHGSGRAVDFMVPGGGRTAAGIAYGNAINAHFIKNRGRLGTAYTVWRDRIWSARNWSGRPYSHPSGSRSWTDRHMNHVHGGVNDLGAYVSGRGRYTFDKITTAPERLLSPRQTIAFDRLVSSISGLSRPAAPEAPRRAGPVVHIEHMHARDEDAAARAIERRWHDAAAVTGVAALALAGV